MRLKRPKRLPLFLWLVTMPALFGLSGCAGPAYTPDAAWQESRPLGADLKAFTPPTVPGKVSGEIDLADPTGNLTLRHALSLALLKNPALEGVAWEVRVDEAKILQEGLPQNPSVGAEVGSLTTSAFIPHFGSTFEVSQTFELGKRPRKTRVAALDTDLAGWDYEAKRLDVLTEATKAFIEVLEAQELVAVNSEQVRSSERILASARQKTRTGKIPPPEIMKAEAHLSSAKIQGEQAKIKLQAAQTRLAATWGQKNPAFEKVEGILTEVSAVPSFEELSELISQNPDVARWKKEAEQRRAALELEKAKAIPDVTLSAGVQHYSDDRSSTGPIFGVSVPLPIFDRNQGGTLAARYKLEKADAESRDAALKANTALNNAYRALVSSYKEATGLNDHVLPGLERCFNAYSQILLKKGAGLSDVVDAHQTLFETRARYIEVLSAYHKSKADVERLVGQRLDSIVASRKEPAAMEKQE